MVFQGEDISLTEDIIKRKIEFVKDWVQFQADEEPIIDSASRTGGGTTTMFTVPARNTLYITSAYISGINNNAGTIINAFLQIRQEEFLRIALVSLGVSNQSLSFPMPLKVEEGETVNFTIAVGQGTGFAGFHGFLIPKKIA